MKPYRRRPFDVVRRERDAEIAAFVEAYRKHSRLGGIRLAPTPDEELAELAKLIFDGRAPGELKRIVNPEPDLFEWQGAYPAEPGFQKTDTSRAAAASIAHSVGKLQSMALAAIERRGRQGFTALELAAHLGLPRESIVPRTTELKAKGKIMDSGMRRENASGRKAIVWISTGATK